MKTRTACLILVPALVALCLAVEVPMPLSPEPGSKGTGPLVELAVECPVTADELHFQVYSGADDAGVPCVEAYTTEANWVAPVVPGSDLPPISFTPGGTYYWTCRARYGDEWSEFFSPRWDFTTVEFEPPVDDPGRPSRPPDAPEPIAPEPGSKSMFVKVELVVDCPVEFDELHYVVYELAGTGVTPFSEKYTNDKSVLAPFGNGLGNDPIYFRIGDSYLWTCRVRHGEEWSDFFAPMWGFTVSGPDPEAMSHRPPPAPPAPIAPEQGSKIRGGAITLVVEAPAATELFNFRVYRHAGDLGRPELMWEDCVAENFWHVPVMMPVITGTYEWSCRIFDGELWSAWFSPSWTFDIEHVPETGPAGRPGAAVLKPEVVPSPCGPSGAEIRFGTALTGPAAVEIYDIAGNLVRTMAASAATTSLRWDGNDQAGRTVGAGTYLCRVRTDDARHVVRITKSR